MSNGAAPGHHHPDLSRNECLDAVRAVAQTRRQPRRYRDRLRWKRPLDLAAGIPLLLLSSPIIILSALAVLLIDRHWPFYADTRIGRRGKPFRCVKLRTMRGDARLLEAYLASNPDESHAYRATRKLKTDPRITRVGAFFRKYSIDELPQLANVLTGSMSLVGPRPLAPNEFLERGESAALLTWVPPGLTGLWQVRGRSDTTLRRRVALDNYYVRKTSPLLDIQILALTPWAVIAARGAR